MKCLVKNLNLVVKNPAKIRKFDREFAKQFNFKSTKFPIQKKTMQKFKNKIKSASRYLFMKIKNTIFILQNKLLKIMLIYY